MAEVTAYVAEFHKAATGPLMLWSLTTFEKDERTGSEQRTYYDVDWSRTLGCYLFDVSGGGGGTTVEVSGIYFAKGRVTIRETPTTLIDGRDSEPFTSPETLIIRERNRTRRLRKLPRPFVDASCGNLLEWLERHGIQQEAVYCSECQDRFPDDQTREHIWWCDETGQDSTPGDRCGCPTRAVCSGDFNDYEEEFGFSPRHPPVREDWDSWWA